MHLSILSGLIVLIIGEINTALQVELSLPPEREIRCFMQWRH